MKKFNKNIIVFLFFAVFVVAGVWGECYGSVLEAFGKIGSEEIKDVDALKTSIDDASDKRLSYHDLMMDVNSVKDNLLGTRVVEKDDTTVVKTDSDNLVEPVEKISDGDFNKMAKKLKELQNVAEENGACFLYCPAPRKENYQALPSNTPNYSVENYNNFISALENNGVPHIDFIQAFGLNNLDGNEMYFKTDHHWTINTGFVASKIICEELNSKYGFDYNRDYVDINNYKIKKYRDRFLGSKGKKVGTYFTWSGADDFYLIAPDFETDCTEQMPFEKKPKRGPFKKSLLFTYNLQKDYYNKNTYATYSGGDYRLQTMVNKLNPKGKKILMIRDSFACAVAPFLALQAGELRICDVRNYDFFVGKKLNMRNYIKKYSPDYVIVLYSDTDIKSFDDSHGLFDFF